MKVFKIAFTCLLLLSIKSYSQTIQDIINQVDLNRLTLLINEFSGEQSTVVGGSTVTILNRQQANNDIAADYLVERFQELDNITITDQAFNTNGRNIIATQVGKTNPNDIYIICAHYDTVANYCADDNATGTAAVLEIARILSTQCLDNTIVYALWDEEEIGLLGSRFYADQAAANGDNILGVLNMDMMGYDGDTPGSSGDNEFDIDYRNIASSVAMKDDIINVLNSYSFDLSVVEVNPGTTASDHSSFWFAAGGTNPYSAVLVGESWETNDQTPFYHTPLDREATLDYPYYHEMVKLVAAYTATVGGLVNVDNTVTQIIAPPTITANQTSASYQWINCDTDSPIADQTSQSFVPTTNGSYAVDVTIGSCTERSECIQVDTLGLEEFSENEIKVYPNPVISDLNIELLSSENDASITLYDLSGKLILTSNTTENSATLNLKEMPQGIYFLTIENAEKSGTFKIVKE
ncbi:M28 family peptidase [Psychroserpens sp.]|uniref:M28 family peptidase n=1 Tax=Psychroserpens sp. TaxID=2020870 RepID=UPI001B2AD561|nr:M28 family peptidase [Psychroserpens sp.]MBO6605728.1 M28 family peptidase [Psychroserpens sp.]MBO6630308.1 M28 family peptidase [Psychroserpens sp.]MBO6652901.1 M28 family peptidase [Psychroserpens sp.]MBO6681327.1 M28 family peptidase [Psychroserpens sp.]MBO6749102.1 M28 family peptidase [Psychroserpens sp.]